MQSQNKSLSIQHNLQIYHTKKSGEIKVFYAVNGIL